jgi:hypothetical protein
VTHRVDTQRDDRATTFEFQGLLDLAALDDLRAAVARAAEVGTRARILLRVGTEVERACLPGLRAVDAEVVAESPYLARWIADPER